MNRQSQLMVPMISAACAALFGCSGAEAVPSDQSVPAQNVSAAVAPVNAKQATHFKQRFDKNADGKIELAELPPRMQRWLTPADVDHDGVLSDQELEQARAKFSERFHGLDANHDGKLEVAELPDHAKEHLAKADADGDGVLSKDELKAFHEQHFNERFQQADTNRDGVLTADEVGAERWAHLVEADADGNGRVSESELKSAFAEHKFGRFQHPTPVAPAAAEPAAE
jgi:Ca2+-binding EF-hand superfamily protein